MSAGWQSRRKVQAEVRLLTAQLQRRDDKDIQMYALGAVAALQWALDSESPLSPVVMVGNLKVLRQAEQKESR